MPQRFRSLLVVVLPALLIGTAGAVVVASPAAAATLTVTSGADSGAGSLRAVIASAAAGDTVVVDSSVTSIDVESEIPVTVGLTIRGNGSAETVIRKANSDDFAILNLRPGIADQDFIIEDLGFDGAASSGVGQAVYAGTDGAQRVRDVTLRGVHVVDNDANVGAGLFADDITGDLLVEDCVFDRSSAGSGAAFYLRDVGGSVTIRNSEFTDGRTGGAPGSGGAIFVNTVAAGERFDISGSSFTGNRADIGGAIRILTASATSTIAITTSEFDGNTDDEGGGGAIHLEDSSGAFQLDSSTFTGTSTTASGGSLRIDSNSGEASIVDSTFDEDSRSAVVITQNTGDFSIRFSTFVAPMALAVNSYGDGSITAASSIFQPSGPRAFQVTSGPTIDVSYSSFLTASEASVNDVVGNLFSTDALLGSLADNGGPTRTLLPADGSPVRDLADPAVSTDPPFDQRSTGFARVIDGRADMGAVELPSLLPAPPSSPAAPAAALPATGVGHVEGLLASALAAVLLGAIAVAGARARSRRP